MGHLEDDIARVAALRGRRLEDYIDPATNSPRFAKSNAISHDLLANIFLMHDRADMDLKAYDALPEAARRFVRSHPVQLNAECYRSALDHMDEEALEILVQSHIPGQVARWLRRHYGDCHPSLRKYP